MPDRPPMVVQSLIFSKEKFLDEESVTEWCEKNDYKVHKNPGIDETEDSWRVRQRSPSDFDPKSFRTIKIEDGVSAVVGHLKDKSAGDRFEIKTFEFQLKDVDPGNAQGEFTGFAAVYGNKDHQGDIIESGAFTRTLNSLDGEVPLLWQHDVTRPIGIGKLEDHSKGLKIHGFLNLGVKVAQEAYELMKPRAGFKRGIIRGLSIGYDVVKDAIEEGVRKLKEIKLWEVSLVTFPANGRALISDVKSAQLLENRISLLSAEIEELKARLVMDGLIDPDDVHSIGVPDLASGDDENNPEDLHLFSDLADQMKAFHLLRRMQK